MPVATDDERVEPGPPVEEPRTEDVRRKKQPCELCDGKLVGNLPSHLAQVHGIRGRNEGRPKRDRAPSSSASRSKAAGLPIGQQMEAIYSLAASIWMVKDPVCGGQLAHMAPMLGQQWQIACESNPKLEEFLDKLAGGGALVSLAAAHIPLAVVMVQHHGPAARAQREAEEAAWLEQQQQAAANGDPPPGWIPPGGVPTDEAYGYAAGSADNAR